MLVYVLEADAPSGFPPFCSPALSKSLVGGVVSLFVLVSVGTLDGVTLESRAMW